MLRMKSAAPPAKASTLETVFYTRYESPIGWLLLAGSCNALRLVSFSSGSGTHDIDPAWRENESEFSEVIQQLQAYFAGKRIAFDVPLLLQGTDFQNSVWRMLQEIPYGETLSYKELATRIGNPKAVRAVGAANGANPIPIIIPCHRVIGNDGSLTGFGGGLPLKKKLLELESRQLKLI
jgi:methylated-DNA-[protein]-cysteine S-methyltransferase